MRVVLGLSNRSIFPRHGLGGGVSFRENRGHRPGISGVRAIRRTDCRHRVFGFSADRYGWRPSLWALGLAGFLIAIPAFFLLPAKRPRPAARGGEDANRAARPPASFAEAAIQLLKIPSFLILAAAGALTSIGTWIFLNWLPLYFKEVFAMSLAGAGFFGASFINASAAVSTVFGGMVSDRVAAKGKQRRMFLQAVLILAAAPTLLVFRGAKSLTLIVVALVLNAALRNAADLNMLPLLCDLAGEDKFAIAFGMTNMVNCLAGGLGIFVAGLLKAKLGLGGVFAGTIGILVCDSLMLFAGYFWFLKRDLQNASLRLQPAAAPSSGF